MAPSYDIHSAVMVNVCVMLQTAVCVGGNEELSKRTLSRGGVRLRQVVQCVRTQGRCWTGVNLPDDVIRYNNLSCAREQS